MANYANGFWIFNRGGHLLVQGGRDDIGADYQRNVMERIVACVNACAGVPLDDVRSVVPFQAVAFKDNLSAAELKAFARCVEALADVRSVVGSVAHLECLDQLRDSARQFLDQWWRIGVHGTSAQADGFSGGSL